MQEKLVLYVFLCKHKRLRTNTISYTHRLYHYNCFSVLLFVSVVSPCLSSVPVFVRLCLWSAYVCHLLLLCLVLSEPVVVFLVSISHQFPCLCPWSVTVSLLSPMSVSLVSVSVFVSSFVGANALCALWRFYRARV